MVLIVKYRSNFMKVNNSNNPDKIKFKGNELNGLEEIEQPNKRECYASYNSQDETLIIKSNDTSACDARRNYYINKDGSGMLVTDLGLKEYDIGTFSSVIEKAKDITQKKGFAISYDDSLSLLEEIDTVFQNMWH